MKNQIEVNKTILEVEQLIAKNSDLPRLTRGEILSLLENITKEDEMKIKKSKPNSNQNSNVHAKTNHPNPNVMVVLPVGTVSSTGAPRPQVSAQRPSFPTLDQIETSSQFENLVTIQKSSSKKTPTVTTPTLTEFTFTTSERSPLEFGLPMSIKTKTASTPSFQPISTLAPDIVEVLKTLGLDKGEAPSSVDIVPSVSSSFTIPNVHDLEPVAPSIDPHSYSHFKPIPTRVKSTSKSTELNTEMQDFLASFGLLPTQPQTRSEKSMRDFSKSNRIPSKTKIQNKTDENVTELKEIDDSSNKSKMGLLTSDMKKVLENMGLIHMKNNSITGEYIFNPVVQTTILDQAKEVNKITKVLDGIRELSKDSKIDSLSQEEIRAQLDNITSKVLNDTDSNSSEEISIESFESEKMVGMGGLEIKGNIPDPLAEVNNSLLSDKNEVKRQQPSDSITSSTSTEIITTTAESEPETTEAAETTTSSEVKDTQSPKAEETSISPVTDSVKAEDSSPSLSDLADSFGGGAVASEEPPPEALPSPRPNGLYFYVDWNTFLNVGSEDTKNRVNLRFAPKVGNPRLFLPVSVP
jgi:hypothetical protein